MYLLERTRITPLGTKTHALRIELTPPFVELSHSFPARAVSRPLRLPVQPPRGSRFMIDSLVQAVDFERPRPYPSLDGGESGAGLSGNATEPSDSSDDTIIDLDEFDLRPVILYKVDPKCPELARRGRITGTVTAEVLVGRDGLVREVSIKKSTNIIFDDEVTAALKLWVFRPWVERNRCLPFRFTVMVEFVLR